MYLHDRSMKTALALALAATAITPAAASARFDLNPPRVHRAAPPVQVVDNSAGSGFDWGDAGIGAAGALGLSMLVVGGGVAIAGKRRGPGTTATP
jgi:hypothetical protein